MATNETLQCDVLIIGSGIAGATAALNLAENENLKICRPRQRVVVGEKHLTAVAQRGSRLKGIRRSQPIAGTQIGGTLAQRW